MQLLNLEMIAHLRRIGGHKETMQPYHLFLFVDSGTCTYPIGGMEHVLGKGDVLVIPSGTRFSCLASAEQPHTKYAIRWRGDEADAYFPGLLNGATSFRPASQFASIKQTFAQLVQIWDRKDQYYYPQCKGMLIEIIARIHQENFEQQHAGKQYRTVKQVRDYILQYYTEPLAIGELSELVKRNPSHLITSFKKHFGVAPLEYMHRIRIAKAEEMLLHTDQNVDVIARELGYCDASYFNRMFKRITGSTPSSYRKHM